MASLLIIGIKKDKIVVRKVSDSSLGFRFGLMYVWHHKLILSIGIISILPLIVTQMFNVSSPDYISTVLKSNSVVYGLADMSYGAGGLLAGLITSWLILIFPNKKIIVNLFALASLVLFFLYIGRFVLLMYLCTFLLGFSNSALRVVINTVLMKEVDKSFMGRSTSIWNGIAQFIEIFISTVIGITNDHLGAAFGFLCVFAIMFVGVFWSLKAIKLETIDGL
ncbi:MFS transporter [Oenococcus oeni]|uniref:MFS transporter n=1 Tax=Oenococcus oeni TaxID=1247 RepID=UPI000277B2CB|nr:MFS transporter [Oenococcus oeni]AWW98872.1 MFS transporter [Oenococcus oeni]EJN99958.1 major facilitator superfamily permease [Oenococcus oeni AWRIB419]EJO08651.1 major facilitator superfamily permease [Oenococcus oeni AWRIB553]EKP89611.1 major facilitator superfamily permease [Oenococcus oeni DSM 20252 = AWRIB129]KEK01888.1 MFS transporter permease [Oenococcus oeni]